MRNCTSAPRAFVFVSAVGAGGGAGEQLSARP